MRQCIRFIAVLCCLGLFACGGGPTIRPVGGEVADTRAFPQDLTVYAQAAGDGTLLLSPERQAEHWDRYRRLYFAPWRLDAPSIQAKAAFQALSRKDYAENLLPRTAQDSRRLVENSAQAGYPNRPEGLRRGIVLRNTALRGAPTSRPSFNNPQKAGEGFPFDMWQDATLPPGTPLYMTHTSRDGAWIFVENALAAGWVAERDIALVDPDAVDALTALPLRAVTREGVLIKEAETGRILTTAGIGALVYAAGAPDSAGRAPVLLPVKDVKGTARLIKAEVEEGAAPPAPLALTAGALAGVGNQLMGQPYGWGSLYENRDCSAMLRDIFTPFGVWLPRNSAVQAKSWSFVDLSGLDPAGKEQSIREQAVPFATLLTFPGHIGLYIGQHEGRAAMFHDMWGVRTEYDGQSGRYVVGRVVVTSTSPGAELDDVEPGRTLLRRMTGISVLR